MESDYLPSISFEKFPVENGEAICCFGEAIVHLDYSVSSAPFVSKETLRVEFRDWSKDKQEPSLQILFKSLEHNRME